MEEAPGLVTPVPQTRSWLFGKPTPLRNLASRKQAILSAMVLAPRLEIR